MVEGQGWFSISVPERRLISLALTCMGASPCLRVTKAPGVSPLIICSTYFCCRMRKVACITARQILIWLQMETNLRESAAEYDPWGVLPPACIYCASSYEETGCAREPTSWSLTAYSKTATPHSLWVAISHNFPLTGLLQRNQTDVGDSVSLEMGLQGHRAIVSGEGVQSVVRQANTLCSLHPVPSTHHLESFQGDCSLTGLNLPSNLTTWLAHRPIN